MAKCEGLLCQRCRREPRSQMSPWCVECFLHQRVGRPA